MELPDDGMWSFEKMHAYLCSVGQFAHMSEKEIASSLNEMHARCAQPNDFGNWPQIKLLSLAIVRGHCKTIFPYDETISYFTNSNKAACCICGALFYCGGHYRHALTMFFCENPLRPFWEDPDCRDSSICGDCSFQFRACSKEETILAKLSNALSNVALPARIKANAGIWKKMRFDPRRRRLN
jgi:hypothetical protein